MYARPCAVAGIEVLVLTAVNLTAGIIPDWSPFSCAFCLGQLLQSHLDNCQNNSPESYFSNPYGLLVSQCSQEGRNSKQKGEGKRKGGEGKARESGVLLSWCFSILLQDNIHHPESFLMPHCGSSLHPLTPQGPQ